MRGSVSGTGVDAGTLPPILTLFQRSQPFLLYIDEASWGQR